MARARRKHSSSSALPPARLYRTALYARLSIEDNGTGSSDSIEMQQSLLWEYARAQPDLCVIAVYVDNGVSGTHFERPGFEQMLEDIRARQIDCIVVKDLSRFGRNYVETGYYLERVFPFLGVRFVAVNDHFDTSRCTDTEELAAAFKNIVNTLFAKDISQKVSAVLHQKQLAGQFIGGKAPYGFLKDAADKHKLVIDPETAPIVRKIFNWREQGAGYAAIARRLNTLAVPCPAVQRFLRDEAAMPVGLSRFWQGQTVKAIVHHPVYAGHMAQGRYRQSLSQQLPPTRQPRESWCIVYNTHAPIIGQALFARVQEQNEIRKTKAHSGGSPIAENPFAGLIYCRDCGTKMTRIKRSCKRRCVQYTYACRNYLENGEVTGCTRKYVQEAELCLLIHASLEALAVVMLDDCLTRYITCFDGKLAAKMRSVDTQIGKNLVQRSTLYEQYGDKVLSDKAYRMHKRQLDEQAGALAQTRAELQKYREYQMNILSTILPRKLLLTCIGRITVEKDHTLHITWNFRDSFFLLPIRDG